MNLEILIYKFCEYATHIRGLSPHTIKKYQHILPNFIKATGISNINEVTPQMTRDYFLRRRTERNWSTGTFICHHSALVVFFDWCIKEGCLSENHAKEVDVPKLEYRIPPKLSKKEALRVLEVTYNHQYVDDYLRYRNHALFSVALYAGLRRKEILSLMVTNVDFENLSIFVRQAKGKKDRVVPMSFTLAQSLRRYFEIRKKKKKTCPEFFCSHQYNMGLTGSGLKRLVEKIRAASRIHFTMHKLRHTFATLMLEGGCDIYSLSRMMGHNNITTTTIYLNASAEHLRGQIGKHPLND